jgi:predicted metal-binding protein
METALAQRSDIQLKAVECLSVCKRACTIAVSAPDKWTYVIGDLDPARDMDALSDYLDAYARDPNGTPPLKQRPAAIRSGTIARIPPLTHKDPYAAS